MPFFEECIGLYQKISMLSTCHKTFFDQPISMFLRVARMMAPLSGRASVGVACAATGTVCFSAIAAVRPRREDDVDRLLNSLPGRMRNGEQWECKEGRLCRWSSFYDDKFTPWSRAMFRAIEQGDQRALDTLAMNTTLAGTDVWTPEHLAAAIDAGLDVSSLVLRGLQLYGGKDFMLHPAIQQGLVACVRAGESSEPTMRFLFARAGLCEGSSTYVELVKKAACLVPDVMAMIRLGVRRGEDEYIALYGCMGDLLCDGGKKFNSLAATQASNLPETHVAYMTSQPVEPLVSCPYWKVYFGALSDKPKPSTLWQRMQVYAHTHPVDTDLVALRALLAEPAENPDTAAAAYAVLAALQAGNMAMLQALVEVIKVPATRGALVVACMLKNKPALEYLLPRPDYSALL